VCGRFIEDAAVLLIRDRITLKRRVCFASTWIVEYRLFLPPTQACLKTTSHSLISCR
jgi:hypothetical protein